jgi:hypothetical protein
MTAVKSFIFSKSSFFVSFRITCQTDRKISRFYFSLIFYTGLIDFHVSFCVEFIAMMKYSAIRGGLPSSKLKT